MKINVSIRRLAFAFVLAAGAALPGRAHAQANLTFSGGLGAPLTLTLYAPVTYAITTAPNSISPYFVLQGVGNVFAGGTGVSGTITYTVNGGAAQTITSLFSGAALGSLAATDAYFFGSRLGVALGNVVVLTAGTLTTTTNFTGAPPAGGSFQTFIIDGQGNKLDAVNGVSGAVPEPSTWALLGLGVAGLGVVTLRRRSFAAARP